MPLVVLGQFAKKLPEISSSDGTTGFLVRKHWTRWIPYALFAPPILLVGIASFVDVLPAVYAYLGGGWMPLVVDTILGLGVLVIVWKAVVFWFLYLREDFLLFTPRVVYHNRRDKLFFQPTNRYPARGVSLLYDVEGLGILGVRRITMNVPGLGPQIFRHASEGEEMERGISHVLGDDSSRLTPSPPNG